MELSNQPTGKFTTEKILDLEMFAQANDLEKISQNSLIGFETFEDAQEVASLLKGEVVQFRKKDGDRNYTNYGSVPGPLTCDDYAEDMGDDYSLVGTEWVNQEVAETDDADETEFFYTAVKAVENKIDLCPDGHSVLITHYNKKRAFAPLFVEYVKNVMMSFHSDVTSYAIGVKFDSDPFDSE